MEIQNAIIRKASIEIESHGLLTAWLDLDFGGSTQGFGGYSLFNPNFPEDETTGRFVYNVLKVIEVNNWDELKGKSIRIKTDNFKIYEIGHIIKDKWYNHDKEIEKL